MKTCKRTKNHNIWETRNKWEAESVFFVEKPTKEQLRELVEFEWGNSVHWTCGNLDAYRK